MAEVVRKATVSNRCAIPVVPMRGFGVDGEIWSAGCDWQARIDKIAADILSDEPALASTLAFSPRVQVGLGQGPALLIGNSNDIALVETEGVSPLEYRMSLLAEPGDTLALRGPRSPAFERYRETALGLGAIDVIQLADAQPGAPVGYEHYQPHLAGLADAVRNAGHGAALNLVPYIGSGGIWKLAMQAAAQLNIDVRVAASPPRLTRRVNDKLWFAARVQELFGVEAVPPTRAAYGPAALVGLVRLFARRYPNIVVKVPDSAGSAGNVKLASGHVLSQTPSDLRRALLNVLRSFGWHDRFPLMVEVWDAQVLGSPSVQLWVPQLAHGGPVIQGIYDQLLGYSEINAEVFNGAVKASLPERWERRLCHDALLLATLLQQLGYFGPLSFDTVLCGPTIEAAQLHWIECNGRWGGTSIPMTLLNRLADQPSSNGQIIVQRDLLGRRSMPFEQVLDALEPILYRPQCGGPGVILPSPYVAAEGELCQLIAVGISPTQAQAQIEDAAKRIRARQALGNCEPIAAEPSVAPDH